MKRGACILFSVLLALGLAGCSAEPAESSRERTGRSLRPPACTSGGGAWLASRFGGSCRPAERICRGLSILCPAPAADGAKGRGERLSFSASVYLALAMTAQGSAGETREEMLDVLGASSLESLGEGCYALQSRLNGGGNTSYSLANGIWVDEKMAPYLKPGFLDSNRYFGAKLETARMDGALIASINAWVEENTAGRIRDLLPAEAADSRMILVNTLLFADGWASPFDPADNQAWVFRAPGGEKPMTMMRQTLPGGALYEDAETEAICLDFADGRTGLLIALPKKEGAAALDAWVGSLDPARLAAMLAPQGSGNRCCSSCPASPCPIRRNLAKPSRRWGCRWPLTRSCADFSAMADWTNRLSIAMVQHQTRLEVSEEGAVAAAATAVAVTDAALAPTLKGREFVVDRPFFCALVDKPTARHFRRRGVRSGAAHLNGGKEGAWRAV